MYTAIRDYFVELFRQATAGWNRFWFAPRDPFALGLLRIFTGLFLVYTLYSYSYDLQMLLSDAGFLPQQNYQSIVNLNQPNPERARLTLSYWDLPFSEEPGTRVIVHALGIGVAVLFTLGLFTRVTSVLSLLVLLSYYNRTLLLTSEFDAVLTFVLFYLCLAPAGAALSIDSYWKARKRWQANLSRRGQGKEAIPLAEPSFMATVATRLLQIHVALLLLMMGVGKLVGDAWWTGDAAWFLIAKRQNDLFDLRWLVDYGPALDVWTHFIVGTQLLFPVLIWNRWLRPLVLGLAALMWLSMIPLTGLLLFCLFMIAIELTFVSPAALRRFFDLLAGEARLQVVYDGLCPMCRKAGSRIKALDIADAATLVDFNEVEPESIHPELTREKCMVAMYVVEGDRLTSGYDAVVRILRALPALWPLAWITFLPGISAAGHAVYRRIAESRAREGNCEEGTCHVHGAAPKSEKQDNHVTV